jgi:hypothetical protein
VSYLARARAAASARLVRGRTLYAAGELRSPHSQQIALQTRRVVRRGSYTLILRLHNGARTLLTLRLPASVR